MWNMSRVNKNTRTTSLFLLLTFHFQWFEKYSKHLRSCKMEWKNFRPKFFSYWGWGLNPLQSSVAYLYPWKHQSIEFFFAKFTTKYLCWSLLFNRVAGCKPVTLLKRDSGTCDLLRISQIFENIFFTKHLRTTASVSQSDKHSKQLIANFLAKSMSHDLHHIVHG